MDEYQEGIPWSSVRVRAQWHGQELVELDPSPLGREVQLVIPFLRCPGPAGPAESGQQHVRVR